MAARTTATMEKAGDKRFNVCVGRKEIGFIVLFRGKWRFLNKLGDPRFPEVAPEHPTADAALAYVNRTIG